MVRHAKLKKRRAGRIGKIKLKNNSWKRWNPKPTFGDQTVKANWDKNKTPKQNLESMGLQAAVNEVDQKKNSEIKANSIVLFDVPESDGHTSRREKFPLTEEEEKYIAKCMAKHGDNYTKMFRDIKTNDLQHTEDKLRKLGARYLLLSEGQRRVEVPEKVKDLVQSAAN